jgi:hypothetical protein
MPRDFGFRLPKDGSSFEKSVPFSYIP